jgi:hypothetical protein
LIIGLLIVGCGKTEQADTNESTPTTNTNEVKGTTEKPVKELTLREKAIGTYERKEDEFTFRGVFLETGIVEVYKNGKKEEEAKWSISKEGELHVEDNYGHIDIIRINKDGSLTEIARRDGDGEREDIPKEEQFTIKKIK